VVDEQGRKMSKSLGNTIEPEEIVQKNGAEILRLWTSMVDFREELRVGKEILARVIEAYLKLRNTLRILSANLYDFDPAVDAVPISELSELHRFILSRYAEVAAKVVKAYDDYDFPVVPQTVNNFITTEVSAFYVNVTKDLAYTLAPKSKARRSAQTAMYLMADGLARLMAPILPITTDELWGYLPGTRDDSVHLAEFPSGLDALADAELSARWQRLMALRDAVNVEIEKLRKAKVVGKSEEAKVELRATGGLADLLRRNAEDLPTIFMTSQVVIGDAPAADASVVFNESDDSWASIEVSHADGVRCGRCWRYVPTVSTEAAHEGLCERCESSLAEARA
jgi:isoleucyl-tRNA synthetase